MSDHPSEGSRDPAVLNEADIGRVMKALTDGGHDVVRVKTAEDGSVAFVTVDGEDSEQTAAFAQWQAERE